MKRHLEPMGDFFNARAPKYDEVHTSHISGGIATKDLIAHYLPEGTRDVLDLGCGTGLELPALFARFPEAHVVGIDLAGDMLALLRERCAGLAVETLRMSYFDYDFPPGRFGAVVSVMSLHHFAPAQKLALYTRVRKTLRPGGVFLNCDYFIASPLRAQLNFLRLRLLRQEPGAMHFDTPLTAKQETGILRQAGFERVEFVWQEKNTKVVMACP
ncbi:MAG: class I SAM-dependent methyltransferase [Oscillospiraceae bacterium]|jgi:tRNA (cmo5U34)-methyltransferase|nr:class I SAM-dependent methyltransferase [Oscillospiraceae bacterium]